MCTKNYFYFQFWHTNQRNGNETLVQRSRPWKGQQWFCRWAVPKLLVNFYSWPEPYKVGLKIFWSCIGTKAFFEVEFEFQNLCLFMTGFHLWDYFKQVSSWLTIYDANWAVCKFSFVHHLPLTSSRLFYVYERKKLKVRVM